MPSAAAGGDASGAATPPDPKQEDSTTIGTSTNTTREQQLVRTYENAPFAYTLCGLSGEEEVHQWTEFCASVFAYKANPPPASYFARHYFNDPDRDASLIRVAVLRNGGEDSMMVASCRVFRRTISLGGGDHSSRTTPTRTTAGGIGEVCTSADHRRRGLAKELLQDAVTIMQKDPDMSVSLLHAAPAFFSIYEKSGYVGTRSQWTEVTIDTSKLMQQQQQQSQHKELTPQTRQARFPEDTKQLMEIHQMYSEQRFAGCIVRSEEYWNNYVSEELRGSLWVVVDTTDDDEQQQQNYGMDVHSAARRELPTSRVWMPNKGHCTTGFSAALA